MIFSVEALICRYCGQEQESAGVCHSCGTLLDPAVDLVPREVAAPAGCPHCGEPREAPVDVCRSCGSLLAGG